MDVVRNGCLLAGVTGTHGKSMCGLLLEYMINRAGALGKGRFVENFSIGDPLSGFMLPPHIQTGWLALEISREGLRKGLYKALNFDLHILTTLQPRKGTPQAKESVLYRKLLTSPPHEGFTIVNADDPLSLETVDGGSERTITYSLRYPKAMVTVNRYVPLPMGSAFEVVIQDELPLLHSNRRIISSFPVRVALAGEVGAYTALAALTAALVMGIPVKEIVRGLKTFPGISRRMEIIPGDRVQIVDDAAPGSLALKALFGSLVSLRFQRIFLCLGIERGEKESLREMARELLEQEQRNPLAGIFLTTCSEYLPPDLRGTPADERIFLETWARGKGHAPIALFLHLTTALQEMAFSLRKGDLVLLLGGRSMNDAGRLLSLLLDEEDSPREVPGQLGNGAGQLGLLNPS